ncbi:unnamed protein product [Cuscuta campestris]|uniref:ABC transmembrane type-1 domain-containing protein n=1 Tax=Cuscuta campestris TaxID=132261 RepID=A0A484MXH4_9ASTE|nr:unnamed protein product [Cuscuta campestris]
MGGLCCLFSGGSFQRAGIRSHAMFMWLNPMFKKGSDEKLRLKHIPLIPEMDTADYASSLLEDAFRVQKTPSLPSAILQAVRWPLAVNAVFAGVNTIASYTCLLLITSFVKFLSEKCDNPNYLHRGLLHAFVFFFAKTMESLSQRQWYFGAHRIGIRIRAALMALTYKKSLLIKHDIKSNGKVINFLNVDVERIGDFFWHIHGIWLLPVQGTRIHAHLKSPEKKRFENQIVEDGVFGIRNVFVHDNYLSWKTTLYKSLLVFVGDRKRNPDQRRKLNSFEIRFKQFNILITFSLMNFYMVSEQVLNS